MAQPGIKGGILVLNAGSSSLKFCLFDSGLDEKISGLAEIGPNASLTLDGVRQPCELPDHRAGLAAILAVLKAAGVTPETLSAAAHRIVHGGDRLRAPARLTPEIHAEITACIPLAPLHNPHNLAAIDALADMAPSLAQYVSFDTGFHAQNPEFATRYALPDTAETRGIRRYGFHGLSYGALVHLWPNATKSALPQRLLAFHLGNGASLCAIKNGISVATTMGYSPVDGLTMGTRTGGIGAGAVLKLVEDHGLERTREILHNESGLAGLSGGQSDMRSLLADPSPEARFAVTHFTYWCARHAGSLIAAMGGLDALAFTGGIGENASVIRADIMAHLGWAGVDFDPAANTNNASRLHSKDSKVAIWTLPAQEERMIARDAIALQKQGL